MEARGGKRETEAELRKQTAPPTCLSLLFCAGPCQAGLAEGRHWGPPLLQGPSASSSGSLPGPARAALRDCVTLVGPSTDHPGVCPVTWLS